MQPRSEYIKEVRKAEGLTQPDAATICRVSLRTWQGWEAGTVRMPDNALELFMLKIKLARGATR